MTTSCDAVRSDLPELALGVLDGPDRARVLAHVRDCPRCTDELAGLAATVDAVATTATTDPPPGFESRVLARLDGPAQPVRRHRAALLAAAAVLLVVVAAGLVAVVGLGRDDPTASRTAAMTTPSGDVVGHIRVTGDPAEVLVAAPGWSAGEGGPYRLRVTTTAGRVVDDDQVTLTEGYAGYGIGDVAAADIDRIEMIDPEGRVVCSAVFA